eukprot:330321_1
MNSELLDLAADLLKTELNQDDTEITAQHLIDIDTEINELYDSHDESVQSILSLGSDWSDEPQFEIGYQLHKIYPYLIHKAKSKKSESKQSQPSVRNIGTALPLKNIIQLRLKIAKKFIHSYKLTSLNTMRDVTEWTKLTIKALQKSTDNPQIPSTMQLAQSMLIWQSEAMHVALTSQKLQPQIEEKLQQFAPKMFEDIQVWMEDNNSEQLDDTNKQSVSSMFEWIRKCQYNKSDKKNKELRRYLSNELFMQITKQLSGNPINENVRRGLRLLYLLILYCRPSKDVFLATKYKICSMILDPANAHVHRLYSFASVTDSVGCILDAILFIEAFRYIPAQIQYGDVHTLRIKDDINRQDEFDQVLQRPITLKSVKILNKPSKDQLKHSSYLTFQKKPLEHSMIHFTDSLCGTAHKAKMLEKVSIKLFQDVLKLMRVVRMSTKERKTFNAIDKFYKMILICQQEKWLRDELLYQLIKQTTNNNNAWVELMGWKLIWIALKYTLPRKQTLQILQYHAAKIASATYSEHCVNIPQIGHHVFAQCTEYLRQIKDNKIKSSSKPKKTFIHRIMGDDVATIDVKLSECLHVNHHNSFTVRYDVTHDCDLQWLSSTILKQLHMQCDVEESGACVDVRIIGPDWIQKEVKILIANQSTLEVFRQELLKWKESVPGLQWSFVFYKREWNAMDWKLIQQPKTSVALIYCQLCDDIKSNKLRLCDINEAMKIYAIQMMVLNGGKMMQFHKIKDDYLKNMISPTWIDEMKLEEWKFKLASYCKKLSNIIQIPSKNVDAKDRNKTRNNDKATPMDGVYVLKMIYSCYVCWNHDDYGLNAFFVTIMEGTKFEGDCGYLVINNSFIGLRDKKNNIVYRSDVNNIVKIDHQIISDVVSLNIMDYTNNVKDKFRFQLRPNEGCTAYQKIEEMMSVQKETQLHKEKHEDLCVECKQTCPADGWCCVVCNKMMIHVKCFESKMNNISTKRDGQTWKCTECTTLCEELVSKPFGRLDEKHRLYYLRFVVNSYFFGLY